MMIRLMYICTVLFLCLCYAESQGQTYDEWFRQKKTQREYLLKQIAALKTYTNYLNKGYNIIKDGTGTIRDFTGNEFLQHRDYFNSLKEVNPELLKNGKVESILRLHTEMEKLRAGISKEVTGSPQLSVAEKQHIKKFLDELEYKSDNEIEELLMVVSPGKIELTDDERIKRIDKVYRSSQDLYISHRKNIASIATLIKGREKETEDMKRLRKMYGFDQD